MYGYLIQVRNFDFEHKNFIILQWGGGITGHLPFTPVMTHKSEVYKFYIFEMNILTELVYLIIFCLFLLFKPY